MATAPDAVRYEPTVKLTTRIPRSLIARAQAVVPGAIPSVIMRIALARLAGMDADQFIAPLDPGRKPGTRLTAD